MSKKTTYIHAENNNKILSSNEVRLYVPPEPEKMKVLIWGKELCNMAEWNDFLKCVEEKTEENKQLKQQLAETEQRFLEFQEDSIRNEQTYVRELAEKDKEIGDLKKWKEWYSIWHENFKKQIKDLTTELETYRPTKLHGNGQCKCFNCNAINWTDWCNKYKGHIYCDDCLKEILKEEQTLQTQLAIQELEKTKDLLLNESKNNPIIYDVNDDLVGGAIDKDAVFKIIDQQIKELRGE